MIQISSAMVIDKAARTDLAGIRWLLAYEQLPSEDVTAEMLSDFLVVRDDKGVCGTVGLELSEEVALLRSLVVAADCRGGGVGKRLAAAAATLAQQRGAQSIYLLTTTADRFFQSVGYRVIARDAAPPGIQRTTQFRSLCPSSAILMVKP